MEQRGIREQTVLATKHTTNYHRGKDGQHSCYVGNSVKSMYSSVAASLRKLRTDCINILYVHWWDYTASVEEVMDGLHTLVLQGKVLYLGVSDTPTWVVSQANTYARLTGRTPFTIYQGKWSILDRDLERDILRKVYPPASPSLCTDGDDLRTRNGDRPWNVLGGGKIRTDAEEQQRIESGEKGCQIFGDWLRTPEGRRVCAELEKVVEEVGAIAWIASYGRVPHRRRARGRAAVRQY